MFKFIKNLKVKNKLLLLVLLFFIEFVLVLSISIFTIHRVKIGSKIYEEIKRHKNTTTMVALLMSDLNEINTYFVTLFAETNKDKMGQLGNKIKDLSSSINIMFEEVITRIPDEEVKTFISGAKDIWQEYINIGNNEFIPAIYQGNRTKAKELLIGVQKDKYDKFSESVKMAVGAMNSKIDELESHADKVVLKNIYFLIGISVPIFLFILFITLLITRFITKPLGEVMKVAREITDGNLTQKEIHIIQRDEIGQLAEIFSKMIDTLNILVSQMKESGSVLSNSSGGLAQISEQSSNTISQLARAISQISSSSLQIAQNSQIASTSAQSADKSSKSGISSIEKLAGTMKRIQTTVEITTTAMKELAKKSAQIGEIIDIITKIADQTNLLALNAAIEAARAGEAGRGFAVVSEEVRKLAESSSKSAEDIGKIIQDVQGDTATVGQMAERGIREIDEGQKWMLETQKQFVEISASIESVASQIEEIASAAEETAASSEETTASSNDQTAAIEEISSSAIQISNTAKKLQELIAKFKV